MTKDDAFVRRVTRDPEGTVLSVRERAIANYAIKLTRTPGAVSREDLEPLRDAGLDDESIVNLADTVAYFNYVNRLAEGLGVELEGDHWDPLVD